MINAYYISIEYSLVFYYALKIHEQIYTNKINLLFEQTINIIIKIPDKIKFKYIDWDFYYKILFIIIYALLIINNNVGQC